MGSNPSMPIMLVWQSGYVPGCRLEEIGSTPITSFMLYKFDGFIFTDEFNPNFPGYKKKGKYVPLHNYVYWQHTGIVPEQGKTVIHHKDGNRNNNEFENLELVTVKKHGKEHKHSLNSRLKMSNNRQGGLFGFSGCQYHVKHIKPWNKVWKSKIYYNNRQIYLGHFHDPLTCEILYLFVKNELYLGCVG